MKIPRFFRRARGEPEIDRELRGYLDALVEERVTRGMSPEEARRAARIELGGMAQVKEQICDARPGAAAARIFQDLRYACRVLWRSPGFAAVVILTLALGIGANTAVFTAVRALLLGPLPYRDADRLLYVTAASANAPVRRVSSPDFGAWRDRAQAVDRIAAYGGGGDFNLTGEGEPERISGVMVTAGFLDLLGVRPAIGRDFTAEEDRPGAPGAVILSYSLWQTRFGGNSAVAGRTLRLDGRGYTVVGVLPASFVFPDNEYRAELLVPMALPPQLLWQGPGFRLLKVLAHVRAGASPAAVRSEFLALARRQTVPPRQADLHAGMDVIVTPLRDRLAGDVRRLLLVLQAAVAMVLLIGCLNLANLQICRALARRKEMALRMALGAARGRLAVQLLAESLLLGGLGGAAGLALAYAGVRAVRGVLPASLHLLETARIDAAALAFTFGAAVITGLVTGLSPMLSGLAAGLNESLKDSGRNTGGGNARLREALVVAEVALAMVLLAGSGLLIRSFARLSAVHPGFDPRHVLSLRISLPGGMLRREGPYALPRNRADFFARVRDRAAAIPGVESAAVALGLPLIGAHPFVTVAIEGRPDPPPDAWPVVPIAPVSAGYFRTMGIPLLAGQLFDESGGAAVVNQAFAAAFFPSANAIGHRIRLPDAVREIVGIAGDVRQQGLRAAESPTIYVSFRQFPFPETFLLVRSEIAPAALAGAAARAVRELDADQPVYDVASMEQRLGASLAEPRSNMLLMGGFAALALLLAALGIFAVISWFVSRRAQEIGIRMALGARRAHVLRMVLGQGMRLGLAGIAIGLAGAILVTRGLRTLLYEVSPADPASLGAVAVIFIAVAAIACYLPARRAARVDPMVVLRHE